MDTITTIQDLLRFNGSALSVTVSLTQNEIRLIAAAPELHKLLVAMRMAVSGLLDTDHQMLLYDLCDDLIAEIEGKP